MSELDDLMSLDPMDLSSQDLEKIITGIRQHRARLASGGKVTKEKGEKKEPRKIDLAILGLLKPALPSPLTTRRKIL